MAEELDDELHARIVALSEAGDALAENEDYEAALDKYWDAFDLLPEPKTDWGAGTWLLTAIGDANFFQGDFAAGHENLTTAMYYPDAIGNPFIHLRLGQCQFEIGNLDRAADELLRAYMAEGAEIFADDDPKYLAFLGTRAKGIDVPGAKKKPFWKVW
ncbi:tetratricopeptide repeat protein [Rhizobium panacihumi]|uniref:tetratricopeptide repeat protein n=1 Tax=Rhizobium panacihumi TaxID=2008450 RepID=UPI003D7AB50A